MSIVSADGLRYAKNLVERLLVLALLLVCIGPPLALAQTETGADKILRQDKDAAVLTPAQQAVVDKITRSPGTVNVGVMKMPDAAAAESALTEDRYAKIVLPFGEGKDITLVRRRPTVKTDGGFTWRGNVEETGEFATLMLWKDGHLSGYFVYKGRVFVINHTGDDIHTMAEVELPPDHAPGTQDKPASTAPKERPPEPTVAPFPDAERRALEAKNITIDVMLLYTKNAASHFIQAPADLLALSIEESNETFRNSGLGNISLRLVHSQEIDYDEAGGGHFAHLYRMADGEEPFKGVKKLRNEKRADIVGLIMDNPDGCGLSTRVGADSEDAFFVVHHTCVLTHSIAHEIGHILGTRHDRAVDASNAPIPYAHGYVNGTKWRDMMSYRADCGGCPRIPFWSNPRIMYRGEPTGTAASDNARVILEQAERVSEFR